EKAGLALLSRRHSDPVFSPPELGRRFLHIGLGRYSGAARVRQPPAGAADRTARALGTSRLSRWSLSPGNRTHVDDATARRVGVCVSAEGAARNRSRAAGLWERADAGCLYQQRIRRSRRGLAYPISGGTVADGRHVVQLGRGLQPVDLSL